MNDLEDRHARSGRREAHKPEPSRRRHNSVSVSPKHGRRGGHDVLFYRHSLPFSREDAGRLWDTARRPSLSDYSL